MTSTRNKNTIGDYQLERQINLQKCNYSTYEPYGYTSTTYLPGDGVIGVKMTGSQLSHNYCDIESELRGIGTTNLIEPYKPINPEFKSLQSFTFMDNRVSLIVPKPMVVNNNERPVILN